MSSGKLRTVLKKTPMFLLIKQERLGKKTWYEIEYVTFRLNLPTKEAMMQQASDVADLMDPSGLKTFKKKGVVPKVWRYWKLEEAEQLFTMAVLRWTR